MSQSETSAAVIISEKALNIYNNHLTHEWSDRLQEDQVEASEWMTQEAIQLSDILATSDEHLMLRFSAGLFANAHTFLCICQQWEMMAAHTIASPELEGQGRVWALFLHILLCEPDLNIELVTMFQEYQEIVYPFGTQPSRLIKLLYRRGWLKDTPLDTVEKKNRITSPAFLRFDVKFLSTISGRLCLCLLQHRLCFDNTSFRQGSNTSYFQSHMRENLDPIYQMIFNHFRPCIVACMLTAVAWASCSRGKNHKEDMSLCIADLIVHVEKIQGWIQEALDAKDFKDACEELLLKKCKIRLGYLREAVCFFEIKCPSLGYSLLSLCAMYTARWKTLEEIS